MQEEFDEPLFDLDAGTGAADTDDAMTPGVTGTPADVKEGTSQSWAGESPALNHGQPFSAGDPVSEATRSD